MLIGSLRAMRSWNASPSNAITLGMWMSKCRRHADRLRNQVSACSARPLIKSSGGLRVCFGKRPNRVPRVGIRFSGGRGPGGSGYGALLEKVADAVDRLVAISGANRYDGRIEGAPRIAPGVGLLLKPGSPNVYERTLATLQSMRHRCFVQIQPETDPATQAVVYVVTVTVFKELEDVAAPLRNPGVSGAFRSDATVDREFEVVDPTMVSTAWIPKGRDYPLEQKLLRKIRDKVYGGR